VNYRDKPEWQDHVRELTGGEGVDHVLEVGGKDTLGRALASLRYGGQVHLIGGVSGFSTEWCPRASQGRIARWKGRRHDLRRFPASRHRYRRWASARRLRDL
jgi:NADPH:quinone reductase-like Zn-dependent oxidoreductase